MEVPPKVVRDAARRHANGATGSSLVRRENFGVMETPESLPVLQAFHEFIENERKAARSKLVTLSLFFIAVVISLIAAAMFISVTFFDQVRGDVNIVQGEAALTRQQLSRVKGRTETALAGLGRRTDMLREDMRKDRETVAAAHMQTTSLVNRLGQMNEVMRMLELENTALRRDLGALNNHLPQVSNTLYAAVAEISRLRDLVVESTRREAGAKTKGGSTNIVASLLLPGTDTGTAWHFPIPE